MEIVNAILLFLIGFTILMKGSEYLIKGASSISRLFNLSPWLIGVVIVGIGTSVPELSINIASVLDSTSIGVGAVLGSNIFNILIIIGLAALISPIQVKEAWVKKDFVANFLAIVVSGIVLLLPIAGDRSVFGITWQEGILLFAAFLGWLWFMVRRRREKDDDEETEYKTFTFLVSALMVVAGIVGVVFGGRWVVSGAEVIALSLKIPEAIVGLSVVAVGTSISELTVSIRAAMNHKNGLAIGNVIGSNIFDFLGIFAISSFFGNVIFPKALLFDLMVAGGATLILYGVVHLGKKYKISRPQGALLIVFYLVYFAAIAVRG